MMTDDLVGVAELTAMLDVSRPEMEALSRELGFPLPVIGVGNGRLWTRSSVSSWIGASRPVGDH